MSQLNVILQFQKHPIASPLLNCPSTVSSLMSAVESTLIRVEVPVVKRSSPKTEDDPCVSRVREVSKSTTDTEKNTRKKQGRRSQERLSEKPPQLTPPTKDGGSTPGGVREKHKKPSDGGQVAQQVAGLCLIRRKQKQALDCQNRKRGIGAFSDIHAVGFFEKPILQAPRSTKPCQA